MTDINTDVMNKIYLYQAYRYAESKSLDPSTQNAALLLHPNPDIGIIVKAVNGLPEGGLSNRMDLYESEHKYMYVEHAERNAIYKAANRGVITQGLTMYCPWICCADCARAIVQAGIKKVVGHLNLCQKTPDRWKESTDIGLSILKQSGVQVALWPGDVSEGKVKIRFNGGTFIP